MGFLVWKDETLITPILPVQEGIRGSDALRGCGILHKQIAFLRHHGGDNAIFWAETELKKRGAKKKGWKLVVHFTTCWPEPSPVLPGSVRVECKALLGTRTCGDGGWFRETRADVRRCGRPWGTGFPLQPIFVRLRGA